LTDAIGEQNETEHWIEIAEDCNYLDSEHAFQLNQQCEKTGRLLGGMINKSEKFCSSPPARVRDIMAEYFTPTKY
jgi:hypothetical protein